MRDSESVDHPAPSSLTHLCFSMGAQLELLVALAALFYCYTPAYGAESCSGFRHLENGRTFFRYGGLLVIFQCRSGYKLHGYQTNSCMSGHWSREPALCVASGCPSPGPLTHGTSSMNEDGSWVMFSCNSGFRLHGSSMLYCKGHTWNSTKPTCKESDMMSSASGVDMQKSNIHHNLQAPLLVMKNQQQSHYGTTKSASKEVFLKFTVSHSPSQTSHSEGIKVTNPKVHLEQHIQYPSTKVILQDQTAHSDAQFQKIEAHHGINVGPDRETRGNGSQAKASDVVTEASQKSVTKSHLPTTVSSTSSLPSGTGGSASSPSSFSSVSYTAITNIKYTPATEPVMLTPTPTLYRSSKSAPPVLDGEKVLEFGVQGVVSVPVASQDNVTPPGIITGSSSADESFLKYSLWSVGEEELTKTTSQDPLSYTLSASAYSSSVSSVSAPLSTSSPPSIRPLASFSASSSSSLNSRQSHTSTLTPPRPQWIEYNSRMDKATIKAPVPSLTLNKRPVCPYPPVPAHGTFYFRNVENPGPREYRHYIQYACYPGYTLAHGDIHSYCQQGGKWSGVTPVCLELTPCSVNNGGCSQLCSHSQRHNQSSSQTQCHCKPGFTLLDDRRTCRDLDECVEGHHQCEQRCINTFGSFKCGCGEGYQLAHDRTSCTDVDECLLPVAVTGCVFGCVNTPGGFHCQCPPGYSLQTADDDCQDIDECAVSQGLGPCVERCHNSPGSYRCSCSYGHILAGDGHSCIAECPPGYRKQPTTISENSTAPALREECVDINECQEEMCEWQCVNLPGSHRCICPRGYTLHRDGKHCKDINGCSRKNGGCSHLCVNHRGGHKCACPASHRLSPHSWRKCVLRTTMNTSSTPEAGDTQNGLA